MIGKGQRTIPWSEAELEAVEAGRHAGETLRTLATRHHVSATHIRLVLALIARWRQLELPLAPPFRQCTPAQRQALLKVERAR
jgi:hypothetical protein